LVALVVSVVQLALAVPAASAAQLDLVVQVASVDLVVVEEEEAVAPPRSSWQDQVVAEVRSWASAAPVAARHLHLLAKVSQEFRAHRRAAPEVQDLFFNLHRL
jgi:hypothetical protein